MGDGAHADEKILLEPALLSDIFRGLVETLLAGFLDDQLAVDEPLQHLTAQRVAVSRVRDLRALQLGIELGL